MAGIITTDMYAGQVLDLLDKAQFSTGTCYRVQSNSGRGKVFYTISQPNVDADGWVEVKEAEYIITPSTALGVWFVADTRCSLSISETSSGASDDVRQIAPTPTTLQALLEEYNNFSGVHSSAIVRVEQLANGRSSISLSPDVNADDVCSVIQGKYKSSGSVAAEYEVSIDKRTKHSHLEVFLGGPEYLAQDFTYGIVNIYQCSAVDGAAYNATAGTTITIVLQSPISTKLGVGDWCSIFGTTSTSMNLPNFAVNYISRDRTVICGSYCDEALIVSRMESLSGLTDAAVRFYKPFNGCTNALGTRFATTSDTVGTYFSSENDGTSQLSGTVGAVSTQTIGSTVPVYGVLGNNQYREIKSTTRFRTEYNPREIRWLDKTIDTANSWTSRAIRTDIKPNNAVPIGPCILHRTPKSSARVVANIVQSTKSGSSTATVRTSAPHGLKIGQAVQCRGAQDTTNFPKMTSGTFVLNVLDDYRFTVAWGASSTGSSYGGVVVVVDGNTYPTAPVDDISAVTWDPIVEELSLVSTNNYWMTGGLQAGMLIDVLGTQTQLGGYTGVDGTWQVSMLSASIIVCKPVYDVFGVRRSGNPVQAFSAINLGGIGSIRPTIRLHDLNFEAWNEQIIRIDGQGQQSLDKAIPTTVQNSVQVGGNVYGTGTFTSYPVGIAVKATTANITAQANNTTVGPVATADGRLVTKPYSIAQMEQVYTGLLTTTTAVAAFAAAGTGVYNEVTAMHAYNGGAAAVDVILLDGTTERLRFTIPAGAQLPFHFPTGIPTTANTAFNVNLSAANTGVRLNLLGFKTTA